MRYRIVKIDDVYKTFYEIQREPLFFGKWKTITSFPHLDDAKRWLDSFQRLAENDPEVVHERSIGDQY